MENSKNDIEKQIKDLIFEDFYECKNWKKIKSIYDQIEQILSNYECNNHSERIKLPKYILEKLIFRNIQIKTEKGNWKNIKIPVWTGPFLAKIDLSELESNDVCLGFPTDIKEVLSKRNKVYGIGLRVREDYISTSELEKYQNEIDKIIEAAHDLSDLETRQILKEYLSKPIDFSNSNYLFDFEKMYLLRDVFAMAVNCNFANVFGIKGSSGTAYELSPTHEFNLNIILNCDFSGNILGLFLGDYSWESFISYSRYHMKGDNNDRSALFLNMLAYIENTNLSDTKIVKPLFEGESNGITFLDYDIVRNLSQYEEKQVFQLTSVRYDYEYYFYKFPFFGNDFSKTGMKFTIDDPKVRVGQSSSKYVMMAYETIATFIKNIRLGNFDGCFCNDILLDKNMDLEKFLKKIFPESDELFLDDLLDENKCFSYYYDDKRKKLQEDVFELLSQNGIYMDGLSSLNRRKK